jgi:hypothetical protein
VIRFVDLTPSYWTDPAEGKPCCAFLDTYDDKFLTNSVGSHVFLDEDELRDLGGLAERCRGLVPKHFWDPPDRGTGLSSTASQRATLAARLVTLLDPMPVKHRLGVLVNALVVLCERQGLDPPTVMRRAALHYDDDLDL